MMNQETINFILQRMVVFLDNAQMLKLKDILDEIARQDSDFGGTYLRAITEK